MSNNLFFDQTSEFYDRMINFDESINNKIKLFKRMGIKERQTADLGCGSGIDSIALKTLNNNVDGFDSSEKMIDLARRNSTNKSLDIDFYPYNIEKIPPQFYNKYNFICSLGNTIANVKTAKLEVIFNRIKELLTNDGSALLQILNYDLIISAKNRILSIKQNENNHLVRFYDFMTDHLVFNILRYSMDDTLKHELISTKLFPHKFENLDKTMNEAGFSKCEYFGNFKFDRFDIGNSKDLVILLTK